MRPAAGSANIQGVGWFTTERVSMTDVYEFDLCTSRGRHTLRREDRATARRVLLGWGALAAPLDSALNAPARRRVTISLGNGAHSTVERIAGREPEPIGPVRGRRGAI